ncbi:alpha/beta hydrolase [Halioxenophilus sp. WMMB6]|uniref:alpha/beta fold hydrolase n=1 Tax=Halioxenophilus sp. WMMB6 TaxID=3073815 RepID=UPI00295E8614|nr:alpha/beta hydrolase [Halioxenophilus sp. WMMB6]
MPAPRPTDAADQTHFPSPRHYAFIHGGGQGSWVWRDTLAELRQQAGAELGLLLALDVPGCGVKRGRTTDNLTLPAIAEELIADITAAGIDQVTLVGHSQAGQVMSLMVAARPQLFQRLVYLSCSIPLPGQTVLAMLGSGRHGEQEHEVGWPLSPQSSTLEQRYRAMFCGDMAAGQAEHFLAQLGADNWPAQSYRFSSWDYRPHTQVPATFLFCLQDRSLPLHWQAIFAERFNADHRVSIDAGHQAMLTRPHTLAEVLRWLPA